MYVCMHGYVCMYVCICMYVYDLYNWDTKMHTCRQCTHTAMCTYIYIYIYAHKHTPKPLNP